jgi:heme-degrading monooxygenase HmoA
MMTAVVLMSREVLPENEQEAVQLMRELRIKALHQPGYLMGETLSSLRKRGKNMVISKWRTVEDFEAWRQNAERQQLEARLGSLLATPAVEEVYVEAPTTV